MNRDKEMERLLVNTRIRLQDGMFNEALAYSQRILGLDPDNISALCASGVAQLGLGRPERAITYFEKVLELGPENLSPVIAVNLATAYKKVDRIEDGFNLLLKYFASKTPSKRLISIGKTEEDGLSWLSELPD